MDSLLGVLRRVAALAFEDEPLRTALRQLADSYLDATQPMEEAPSSQPPIAESLRAHDLREAAAVSEESKPREPLPELTLGQAKPDEPSITLPDRWKREPEIDRDLLEQHCRMKAEGARWAATRRRQLSAGVDYATEIGPRDREIIARAKAIPDCYLWMCHPNSPMPLDVADYERIADHYDVLAELLEFTRQFDEDGEEGSAADFEQLLYLIAETQSALRVAIAALDGPVDSDQVGAFRWLKGVTAERQVFISKYMRADDIADPTNIADLIARVAAFREQVQESRRRLRLRRKLLGKVRHKSSKLAENPQDLESWRILIQTVEELVADGLPPSHRELREAVLPHIESLPELDEVPRGFSMLLAEIDRFLSVTPSAPRATAPRYSPEVREVAELLRGTSVVLIGGECRGPSREALESAFELDELIWLATREHQSIDGFEPYVARPEVAVVLLAIRWSSHSFGDVKDFCDRHGKPLVRLPTGYNPNQVATQILAQCSERLRLERATR